MRASPSRISLFGYNYLNRNLSPGRGRWSEIQKGRGPNLTILGSSIALKLENTSDMRGRQRKSPRHPRRSRLNEYLMKVLEPQHDAKMGGRGGETRRQRGS